VSAGSPVLLVLLAWLLLRERVPVYYPIQLSLCIAGVLMVDFPSATTVVISERGREIYVYKDGWMDR